MEKRFLYHGNAAAFGGWIRRPFSEVLDAQASSVLPITGGHGTARVEDYRYRDLISFRAGWSTVAGSESVRDGVKVHNTLSTVTIEGLNVMGMVTADRVVGRLVSEKPEASDDLPMLPVGSYFVNLRIAGVPVNVVPYDVLFQCGTLGELAEACRKQTTLPIDSTGRPLQLGGPPAPRKPAEGGAPSVFEDRLVLTSLYARPASLPAGCVAEGGWGIRVPGFGTVYLGELLVTRYSRRLTMVRIEMGSPVEGTLNVGDLQGNGTTYP